MPWHWFVVGRIQSFHLLSPYATGAGSEAMAASGLNGTSLLSSAGLPAGLAAAAGAFNAGGLTAAGLTSATSLAPPTMTMQSMTMQPAMASIAPQVPNISKLQELYAGSTIVSIKGYYSNVVIPSLCYSFN